MTTILLHGYKSLAPPPRGEDGAHLAVQPARSMHDGPFHEHAKGRAWCFQWASPAGPQGINNFFWGMAHDMFFWQHQMLRDRGKDHATKTHVAIAVTPTCCLRRSE